MNQSGLYLNLLLSLEPRLTDGHWREIMELQRQEDYSAFLRSKEPKVVACGIEPGEIAPVLFDWQADIVRWALRRGRAAIFSDCGTGKTLMQLEWARQIGKRVLILAPFAVGPQTIEEAREKLGVTVEWADSPVDRDGIFITNYEKLHRFASAIKGGQYDTLICDESSILKSMDGKTRSAIIALTPFVKYVLMCTATPSPNDLVELGNHAEALGIKTNAEMRAAFFVHDSGKGASGGWRLKGHAKDAFWDWVAEWAVYIRKPSDLGYDDGRFVLPPLNISTEIVTSDWIPNGHLFPGLTKGITGRTEARRATMEDRINRSLDVLNNGEQWIVWCDLNDEGRLLHKALDGQSVLIEGSTPDAKRLEALEKWRKGEVRILISKASVFGFGLNFQHCHNMLFLGLGDSQEKFYQAVRREWRFGQLETVNVVIVTSDAEVEVVENVKRKEKQAEELAEGIVRAMRAKQIANVKGVETKKEGYKVMEDQGLGWRMKMGDCIERIREIETGSVGLTVFSPPFCTLYTYSDLTRDLGNCADYDEFFKQFDFLIPELLRVTMPGRRCCVHVQQLTTTKVTHGVIGWRDFRADVVKHFVESGWVYDGEIGIHKDPQAQAIRTKSKALMFLQKNKDSAWSRPAMADYILLFRHPGDNKVPVKTDITNEEWIQLAHPGWAEKVQWALDAGMDLSEADPVAFLNNWWYGISESDTLNYQVARDNADDKHICPLQLETIRRCIRLWSNRHETILDPFAGIGSTGVVALEQEREFVGLELKPSYYKYAVLNLKASAKQHNLFAALDNQAAIFGDEEELNEILNGLEPHPIAVSTSLLALDAEMHEVYDPADYDPEWERNED